MSGNLGFAGSHSPITPRRCSHNPPKGGAECGFRLVAYGRSDGGNPFIGALVISGICGHLKAPARCGDTRFEAEAADDLLQRPILPLIGTDQGRDLYAVGAFDILAFDLLDVEIDGQFPQKKCPDMRLRLPVADDADGVATFQFGRAERLDVDQANEGAQQQVHGNDESRGDRREREKPRAAHGADRSRTPQGRGGIQATHVEALLEDDAGTEEADPGHDLGGDASQPFAAVHELLVTWTYRLAFHATIFDNEKRYWKAI